MGKRNFSVVLHEEAATVLGGVIEPFLKGNSKIPAYVLCKAVNPDGVYFHMTVEFPETGIEMELQIPHAAVKAIVCAADLKKVGFV